MCVYLWQQPQQQPKQYQLLSSYSSLLNERKLFFEYICKQDTGVPNGNVKQYIICCHELSVEFRKMTPCCDCSSDRHARQSSSCCAVRAVAPRANVAWTRPMPLIMVLLRQGKHSGGETETQLLLETNAANFSSSDRRANWAGKSSVS